MTRDLDIGKCLEFAKRLVFEAGKLMKHGFEGEKIVETKTCRTDVVTNYDRQVEELLINGLAKEYPNHKFIGEESTAKTKETPELTEAPTWILDPIDGTMNYVHKFPHVCISLALAVHGEIVLGIIHNPIHSELFHATKGGGAFLNDEPIRTSGVTELRNALSVTEPFTILLSTKTKDIKMARFEALLTESQGLRSTGSAALALAYLARGSLDCFHLDGLMPWDIAAGMLIVREAGGTVIDTKGGAYDFMKPNTVAAASEQLATEVSKLIVETDLKTQRKRLQRS